MSAGKVMLRFFPIANGMTANRHEAADPGCPLLRRFRRETGHFSDVSNRRDCHSISVSVGAPCAVRHRIAPARRKRRGQACVDY
jgi:hypothetical protein